MPTDVLELAQRRIATVDVELGKTKLHAPFSGTIIERRADRGWVLGVGEPDSPRCDQPQLP